MFEVVGKSVNSIASKELMKTSIMCVIVTAVILSLFVGGAMVTTSNTEVFAWGWADKILDYFLNTGSVFIAWFLFPVLIPVIASFFVDRVADEIEVKDYKGILQRQDHKISTVVKEAIRFSFVMLLLNILCLPFLIFPPLYILAYYLVNSYLISREFFDMAGGCYLKHKDLKKLRKANRFRILTFGFIILVINNIPVLNLFGPIIAITIMVHLFFRLYKKSGFEQSPA